MRYTCDICGRMLEEGGDRFVVKVEVFAACDTIEMSLEDLAKDHSGQIRALLDKMEQMSAQELQDGVYCLMRFDLCTGCQKLYLRDPLGRGSGSRLGEPENN